jgi:hypothetical protein
MKAMAFLYNQLQHTLPRRTNMKKGLLTFAALMLLALGSLAMSSDKPATEQNSLVCQPSDCCPIQCPK